MRWMIGRDKRALVEEYEVILRQIRDVVSVRMVLDDTNSIQEIHVLTGRSRGPKQIVRDIESVLLAQFNTPIDHKKISVAQLDLGSGRAGKEAGEAKVTAVNLKTTGAQFYCSVILEVEGAQYVGEAQGPAASWNRLRLVAEATLRAVELYTQQEVTLALEDLRLFQLGESTVVVVAVTMVLPQAEETVAGAWFVRGEGGTDVAQAVLKAVGSHLPIVTAGGKP